MDEGITKRSMLKNHGFSCKALSSKNVLTKPQLNLYARQHELFNGLQLWIYKIGRMKKMSTPV